MCNWGVFYLANLVNIAKIRQLAKDKGLSMSFLCRKIGVANVYFNDVEKHNRKIPDDRFQIIADLLDTTPEYLKDETDEKEKPTPEGELGDDVVVLHRDGKRIVYHIPQEKLKALQPLLDQLEESKPDPDF